MPYSSVHEDEDQEVEGGYVQQCSAECPFLPHEVHHGVDEDVQDDDDDDGLVVHEGSGSSAGALSEGPLPLPLPLPSLPLPLPLPSLPLPLPLLMASTSIGEEEEKVDEVDEVVGFFLKLVLALLKFSTISRTCLKSVLWLALSCRCC